MGGQELCQFAGQQRGMVDDVAVAEAGEAADRQLRVCLPQMLDGFFHVALLFPVPAGDVGLRLYREFCAVEIEPCGPGGPDGLQTDMLRDAGHHGLHALLRLAHEAQRPRGHRLLPGRFILLWRHDLEDQAVQDPKVQIFRPTEDHVVDPDARRGLQKDCRSAAERFGKE